MSAHILKYTINLVTGDWSKDGHEKTDIQTIRSNRTRVEITKLYESSVLLTGVDTIKYICSLYDDYKIEDKILNKLHEHGLDLREMLGVVPTRDEGDVVWADFDSWPHIYMEFCKLSDPNLKWKFINNKNDTIDIGGYGLFS